MIPQQQQNILHKRVEQFENLRKKPLYGDDLYPLRQKIRLQQFLQGLREYPKITAVMIQHQHKSIKTLPKQILNRFPQFNQRTQRCINCCKKNTQLLQKIRSSLQINLKLKPSSKSNQNDIKINQNQHICGGKQHSHSSKQSIEPNKILNIFNHLCREYSNEDIHINQRSYMKYVIQNIGQYLNENQNMKQNLTTLIIGCGMGALLKQIKLLYKNIQLPISSYLIQGHQSEPQYYLLSQYILNYHQPNDQLIQIYPYIHNFSNHLYAQTPYTMIKIPLSPIQVNPYALTFGQFEKLYKSHCQQWSIIVTTFYNYSITDILLYIQLIYKILRKGGLWIDISTASFENNLLPYMSYRQYQNILQKSKFRLIKKQSKDQLWYVQANKLIKQWRRVHYRIMVKQQ